MNIRLIHYLLFSLVVFCWGAAIADPAGDLYRLNPQVQPLRQQLDMTINPNGERYSGTTRIELGVREPVDSILLHAQDLRIQDVRFGDGEQLSSVDFEILEHALLRVRTNSKIMEPMNGAATLPVPLRIATKTNSPDLVQ